VNSTPASPSNSENPSDDDELMSENDLMSDSTESHQQVRKRTSSNIHYVNGDVVNPYILDIKLYSKPDENHVYHSLIVQ